MASQDNSINFGAKFRKILPQNIKLSDIMQDTDKAKTQKQMGSIFNYFEFSKRKNDELDIEELNRMIERLDTNHDDKIDDHEIKNFKDWNFNPKALREFLERVHSKLTIDKTQSESLTDTSKKYSIEKNEYGGGQYVQYNTQHEKNASAIYDAKNDVLLNENLGDKIQITGVKAFQNKVFKDGKFIKPDKNFDSFPKILIKNNDGTTSEIELKIDEVNISSINDEEEYMYILTNTLNRIQELPENVQKDLTDNVKFIRIKNTDSDYGGLADGEAHQTNKFNDDYYEGIDLHIRRGLDTKNADKVLIHEIGHTVDSNVQGSVTESNKKTLDNFIYSVTMDHNIRGNYALTNPQELFAEYYAYKNGGSSHADKMFDYLENSIQNGTDIHGWKDVKELLDNVSTMSQQKTDRYHETVARHEAAFKSYNNSPNAIPEEKFNKYDTETLWEHYNTGDIGGEFEKRLTKRSWVYGIENYRYNRATNEEKLEMVKTMRNDPYFKDIINKLLNRCEEANK